jgi:hypothetical protein
VSEDPSAAEARPLVRVTTELRATGIALIADGALFAGLAVADHRLRYGYVSAAGALILAAGSTLYLRGSIPSDISALAPAPTPSREQAGRSALRLIAWAGIAAGVAAAVLGSAGTWQFLAAGFSGFGLGPVIAGTVLRRREGAGRYRLMRVPDPIFQRAPSIRQQFRNTSAGLPVTGKRVPTTYYVIVDVPAHGRR